MTVKTATKAMRRKAGAGRPAPEVGRMTTARAWKLAMPRAAEDTLGVQAAILRVDEERKVRDALAGLVGEHALTVLLEGPEERFGVAILDAPVLAAFIEAATTGRVSTRPVAPREPTRTDATISADLLDSVLEKFEANLSEMDDPPNLAGYRYAAPLVDARAMSMTLADGAYSVFRMTADLGGGIRQGEVVVAFPVAPRGVARKDAAAFQQALADNVMGAPAELDAILHRRQMPLSAVTELRPGDVLRVPLAALAGVRVVAVGGSGVARARLGQQGGFRAVRITRVHGEDAADLETLDFEEAAPPNAPVALPPGARPGPGAPAPTAPPSDERSPAMRDLPPLAAAADALPDVEGLPPLGGEADLPDLDAPDESEEAVRPEVPGLPPLSG